MHTKINWLDNRVADMHVKIKKTEMYVFLSQCCTLRYANITAINEKKKTPDIIDFDLL